jgi:lipoate-protein ligase A
MDPEAEGTAFMVWQPERSCIVLGTSNTPETAVHLDLASAEGVPVYKRHSGGQTVILTPRTLVISIRFHAPALENPKTYFRKINRIIMDALEETGVKNLSEKGISDIAIGEKKILGSSIYRKRTLVLYHAVLNISETPEYIARFLKHPSKEPDYRAGRKHEEFVTSILAAGYPLENELIRKTISRHIAEKF